VRYPGLVEPDCLCQVVIQTDVVLSTLTPDSFTAELQTLFIQGLAITLGVPPSQVAIMRIAAGSVVVSAAVFPPRDVVQMDATAIVALTEVLVSGELQLDPALGDFQVSLTPAYGNVLCLRCVPMAGRRSFVAQTLTQCGTDVLTYSNAALTSL
jgi:hypothetical protein